MVPPSGMLTPAETIELTASQRTFLFGRFKRQDLLIKLSGALLLAVSGLLVWLLIHDPLGTLPGAPAFWKGAPMILGATFFGINGALLMLLRRFSLSVLLVALLLAGAFAAGAQGYARTVSDSEELEMSYALPAAAVPGVLEELSVTLSESRVRALAQDLAAAGHIQEPPAFDELALTYGAPRGASGVQVTARFTFCPFVHARQSPGRYMAGLYLLWLADRHVAAVTRKSGGAAEARVDPLRRLDTLARYLYRRGELALTGPGAAASWLLQRERDPELKQDLEAYLARFAR